MIRNPRVVSYITLLYRPDGASRLQIVYESQSSLGFPAFMINGSARVSIYVSDSIGPTRRDPYWIVFVAWNKAHAGPGSEP